MYNLYLTLYAICDAEMYDMGGWFGIIIVLVAMLFNRLYRMLLVGDWHYKTELQNMYNMLLSMYSNL